MVAVARRNELAARTDGRERARERLEAFGAEVLAEATNRPVQTAITATVAVFLVSEVLQGTTYRHLLGA